MPRITRNIRIAVVLGSLFLLLDFTRALPATINAKSCSQNDVQVAIDAASDGDTVLVPAGNCRWSSAVYVHQSKGLVLQGSGIDKTVIVDGTGSSSSLLFIKSSKGHPVRITGFTFDANGIDRSGLQGEIQVQGDCRNFRIDHIRFSNLNDRGIVVAAGGQELYGVIDHCIFEAPYETSVQGIAVLGAGAQDGATWERPLTLGTYKAVYIEDCTFKWASPPDSVLDAYAGARYVFRHNKVMGSHVGHHGCDSGNYRSVHSFEIYGNTFSYSGEKGQRAFHFRGGTGVVFDNTFVGNYVGFTVSNYRSCGSYGVWGKCDGTNPLDGNEDSTGYPCLDQIGRSTDSDGDGVEDLHPLYEWNNKVNDHDLDIMVNTAMCPEMANHIKEGRDYCNDTKMPGYTPYTYPHPLTQSGGAVPPPPENLKVN